MHGLKCRVDMTVSVIQRVLGQQVSVVDYRNVHLCILRVIEVLNSSFTAQFFFFLLLHFKFLLYIDSLKQAVLGCHRGRDRHHGVSSFLKMKVHKTFYFNL